MSGTPRRGELWWCEMPDIGRRPVVVLSRDAVIPGRRMAIVAPCTTNIRAIPSQVVLEPGTDPVPQESAVNLDSVENVPIAFLTDRMGRLSSARMQEMCAALEVAVGCSP